MVHSLQELLTALKPLDKERIAVIGGASIYELLLPYCETAQVTKTYVNQKADRFHPNLDQMETWELKRIYSIEEENGIRYQYIDYVNKSPIGF